MGHRHFLLPDVGEGLTEADIVAWKVAVGDQVSLNQPLCDIETAKAVVELPSPYAGTIVSLMGSPGETIAVGSLFVVIDDPSFDGGETAPSEPTPAAPAAREAVLVGYGVAGDEAPVRHHRRQGAVAPRATVPAPPSSGPVRTTPPVRLYAKQHGVALETIVGTGHDGLVTRADIERALARPSSAPPAPVGAVSGSRFLATDLAPWHTGPREERLPLRGVAKAMAESMALSKSTIPHATVYVRTDVSGTAALVAGLRGRPSLAGAKVSPLVVVAMAVVDTLRRFPGVNASFDETTREAVVKRFVHLGIAADTPRGLIVPNIKDADRLDLITMATSLAELVAVARAGTTTPAAMQHGTFTITNVGPMGVDGAAAVIPPGTGAILAIGAMTKSPWVVDDQIVIRDVMELSLSFDHRIIDGALASRFLRALADTLGDPAPVLLAP